MTELFGLPGWLVEIVIAAVGWLAAIVLAGKILGLFLRRFERSANQNFAEGGLQNGGYWIGIGERTLIYFFVLSGGITKVWVNGVLVYADGQVTGARPGRFIARSATVGPPEPESG